MSTDCKCDNMPEEEMKGKGLKLAGQKGGNIDTLFKLGDAALLAAALGITATAAAALIKKYKNRKGKGLKLAGQGLILSGQGLTLAGQGWKKNLGATLMGFGAASAASSKVSNNPLQNIMAGVMLGGIGAALMHADRKKKQMGSGWMDKSVYNKYINKQLKTGSGKNKMNNMQIVKQANKIPVSAKDVFGPKWRSQAKKLVKAIEQAHMKQSMQEGSGIKSVFKKYSKKALNKLKDFAAGKTKFKPSDLANYTAAAIGAAGAASAFIPGVDIISVPTAAAASLGLKSAGLALETSGRGHGKGKVLTGMGNRKVGTKRAVWNGTAMHTSSGLTKADLMKNKRGKIVSKKQHEAGQQAFKRNKLSAGFKKGKGYIEDVVEKDNMPEDNVEET